MQLFCFLWYLCTLFYNQKKTFGHSWCFQEWVCGLNQKHHIDVLCDKMGMDVTPNRQQNLVSRVHINVNNLNHERNDPKGHLQLATDRKCCTCNDHIQLFQYKPLICNENSKLNIHLPYKQDPNNINGIHMCFFMFCTNVCVVKIVKWNFLGIAIIKKSPA